MEGPLSHNTGLLLFSEVLAIELFYQLLAWRRPIMILVAYIISKQQKM